MIKKIRKKIKKIILKINNNKNVDIDVKFSNEEISSTKNHDIEIIENKKETTKNINDENKKLQIIKYYNLNDKFLKWYRGNIIKNRYPKKLYKSINTKGINFNYYFKPNIYYLLYKYNIK